MFKWFFSFYMFLDILIVPLKILKKRLKIWSNVIVVFYKNCISFAMGDGQKKPIFADFCY